MKVILKSIAERKREFAQLPFFAFMQDTNIDPRQRLAWAPCAAPFVMSFGELNRNILREEPTQDPIQQIINQHTYEDDSHWVWFLEDLETLGLNPAMDFSDSLEFLWSKRTQAARHLAAQLYRYSYQASPIQRLIVIEVIEATASVFLTVATKLNQELKAITGKEYRYFGGKHYEIDFVHSLNSGKTEHLLKEIEFNDIEQSQALDLVANIFSLFTDFTHSLLAEAIEQQTQSTPSIV